MDSDILKIVKEKLPAIQAEAIASYVKEAEANKVINGTLSTANDRLLKELATLRETHSHCTEMTVREVNVKARENAVEVQEKQQALNSCKLDCEKEKTNLVIRMFETVFRNAGVRRSVTGSTPISCGQNSYPSTQPFSHEETVTQD